MIRVLEVSDDGKNWLQVDAVEGDDVYKPYVYIDQWRKYRFKRWVDG